MNLWCSGESVKAVAGHLLLGDNRDRAVPFVQEGPNRGGGEVGFSEPRVINHYPGLQNGLWPEVGGQLSLWGGGICVVELPLLEA